MLLYIRTSRAATPAAPEAEQDRQYFFRAAFCKYLKAGSDALGVASAEGSGWAACSHPSSRRRVASGGGGRRWPAMGTSGCGLH